MQGAPVARRGERREFYRLRRARIRLAESHALRSAPTREFFRFRPLDHEIIQVSRAR